MSYAISDTNTKFEKGIKQLQSQLWVGCVWLGCVILDARLVEVSRLVKMHSAAPHI